MGFLAFALLLPEASKTGCCTEFPGFCLLILCYTDSLLKTGFGFSLIVQRLLRQEFAFEAIAFGFVPPFSCCVYKGQRFREQHEPFLWFPLNLMRFGEECQKIRSECLSS